MKQVVEDLQPAGDPADRTESGGCGGRRPAAARWTRPAAAAAAARPGCRRPARRRDRGRRRHRGRSARTSGWSRAETSRQRSALVRSDSPVAARSVHGQKHRPAAGSGSPRSRRRRSAAITSPPPAESPASASEPGSRPWSSSQRYASTSVVERGRKTMLRRATVVQAEHAPPRTAGPAPRSAGGTRRPSRRCSRHHGSRGWFRARQCRGTCHSPRKLSARTRSIFTPKVRSH